ncbi:hypothetical protein RN001_010924 [Aquatica leii]|uniref:NIPSNAP domain-containing protein n=1 Tax=Aquatica leii TaxID=1421715 RepID=A0AAN7QHU2_9COLE|nr:hypothetical protein RN001_010924 [Aquatica leii]
MACSWRRLNKLPQNIRLLSTTQMHNDSSRDTWLSKMFVRRIEPTKESHSRMLSDKEVIYALHTHNYKSDSREKYLNNCKNKVDWVLAQNSIRDHLELTGSWTVSVGDQDQALHLWKFTGGFETIDLANELFTENEDYQKLNAEESKLIRSRHLQYMLAFSYWPNITSRQGKNIYEIRSYSLKPGTMIEWGNNWARGINYRQNNNEAFAGFFSQIGRLYNVHHIWCYKNLIARKESRESSWRSPGWDECVAYTVPLIRETHCRILNPTSFSPTQ